MNEKDKESNISIFFDINSWIKNNSSKIVMDFHTVKQIFDLSEYGFLPSRCVDKLPYRLQSINNIVDVLNSSTNIVRSMVDRTKDIDPTMSFEELSLGEKKYLYSVLCMIVQRYVWESDEIFLQTIPRWLGLLWTRISDDLGIVPILTHAAVDLWNWRLNESEFGLDNLKSINLMLPDEIKSSEEWFYLVMVAIEGVGGKALEYMNDVYQELKKDIVSEEIILNRLIKINDIIVEINRIIKRMYEKCDPGIFFNNLRIYLSGYKNIEKFPEGLKIESLDVSIKSTGGSAAQSSLIQAFDIFFSVDHKGEHTSSFLLEMRNYMPSSHRKFLEYMELMPPLSDYISITNNSLIKKEFNNCLQTLCSFRKIHMGIVHRYIVTPSGRMNSSGTGGTDAYSFCKDVMNETDESKLK